MKALGAFIVFAVGFGLAAVFGHNVGVRIGSRTLLRHQSDSLNAIIADRDSALAVKATVNTRRLLIDLHIDDADPKRYWIVLLDGEEIARMKKAVARDSE